ncbi:MAG TPA: hypothetical protein VIG07_17740 [Methylomirabilota bacterium]|jgi:hypothetical protein
MGDVKHRPALLLTILIYVTLDLSLPAMPGAFVFEAEDSVESIQISRARAVAEVVALPASAGGAVVRSPRRAETGDRLTPASQVERGGPPVTIWSRRAPVDPAPPSEDPH